MKKLTVILFIIFAFIGGEIIAQVSTYGSGTNKSIYKTQGAWDHSSTSGLYGSIGVHAVDLMSTDKNASDAATSYTGPSHNGMGAVGYGSFTSGVYNRASGSGSFVGGFHNVAGPLTSQTTSADGNSIGQTAFGYGTQATGNASFSAGEGTEASGSHGVVFGKNTLASGNYSTAMGESSTASGTNSTALGKSTSATGNYSTSLGNGTTASGSQSTALGESSTASGYASLATGRSNTASGYNATAMGRASTASGYYSTVIGYNATASDFASFVIGQYNSSGSSATSAGSYDVSAPAFVIGNGTSGTVSDAFKVMFNGDATVSNDLTIGGDVVVSSDARLKSNIVSLGSTIARLLLIDGKTYTMKKDGKQKIGVLAQDIQKVFPELVSEDDNEMLAVNYQGLVPVLINALKEQDDKISRLEVLVEKLMSDK
jgi:hypothetical protein